MAKVSMLFMPVMQFFDDSGDELNGGTLTFSEAGSATAKDTYADSAKAVTNPNPITLDSAGRPDNAGSPIQIWLDGSYKMVVKNSSGTIIRTEDNVVALAETQGYLAKTSDYTVAEADSGKLITLDATSGNVTLTLLAAATAGAGFTIVVKRIDTSSNTCTIDGNASETIDGDTTKTLDFQYASYRLTCDGSNWHLNHINQEQVYKDTNGNEVIEFITTASAVNNTIFTNAATGNPPLIGVNSEADIGMNLEDSNDNEMLELKSTASAVNHFKITNAATGNAPELGVESEADIGLIIRDSNDNEILEATSTASATNHIGVVNAATGNNPHIRAEGEANTGITVDNSEGEEILILNSVATSVNELTVSSAATGNNPEIAVTGDDTNVGLDIQPKGTGTVNILGTATSSAELRLSEDTDTGSAYVGLKAPDNVASSFSLTLPGADGSNTHVLTTDGSGTLSFAAPNTPYELISSQTASSSASIDFTGLTSSYIKYVLEIVDLVPATDNADLWLRTSTDNGSSYDSGASDYAWSFWGSPGISTPTGLSDAADAQIKLLSAAATNFEGAGSGAGESVNATVELYNPSSALNTHVSYVATYYNGELDNLSGSGVRVSAADVDAFQILMSSGNIASGEFRLYGIKAS